MADPVTFIVEFNPVERYTARAARLPIVVRSDTQHRLHDAAREAVACHFDDGEERVIWFERFILTAPVESAGPIELDIDDLPSLPPDSYITG